MKKLEYVNKVRRALDTVSPTVCLAKWYDSTILYIQVKLNKTAASGYQHFFCSPKIHLIFLPKDVRISITHLNGFNEG